MNCFIWIYIRIQDEEQQNKELNELIKRFDFRSARSLTDEFLKPFVGFIEYIKEFKKFEDFEEEDFNKLINFIFKIFNIFFKENKKQNGLKLYKWLFKYKRTQRYGVFLKSVFMYCYIVIKNINKHNKDIKENYGYTYQQQEEIKDNITGFLINLISEFDFYNNPREEEIYFLKVGVDDFDIDLLTISELGTHYYYKYYK